MNLTDPVDKEIYKYLDFNNPKSFLLFAGAGSGKTRTLVNVLQEVKKNRLQQLVRRGQEIAIITYTNAACDEIKHRLEYDPIFNVSTIHSFAWELIKTFPNNIRESLIERIKIEIEILEIKIIKARNKEGVTAIKNKKELDKKRLRLKKIKVIKEFTYNPNNNKLKKESISHSEVINIASSLISNEYLMQNILINRFPVLLIDESQDTKKNLLEAFIVTQKKNKNSFCIGLFGDMMQRIYNGGKHDLDTDLPEDWRKPEKIINYRCPKRITLLINNIRKDTDNHQQKTKEGARNGNVRLFIVNSNIPDK